MPPPDKLEPCGCGRGCVANLDGAPPVGRFCKLSWPSRVPEPPGPEVGALGGLGEVGPVDPDQTIADAERAERERQEEAIRQANAQSAENPSSPFPEDDQFFTTGLIRIWLGFNEQGKQHIRFDWDESVPNTSVIGACEFLSAVCKAKMVRGLE